MLLLCALLSAAAAAGPPPPSAVPTLAALSPPRFIPIETCPPLATPRHGAAPCPGWRDPQKDGMVNGDNATMCFHLGCCYSRDAETGAEACLATAPAGGADPATDEWFSGNQPLPSLSNTRGTVQLPLETPDALSVDCIYFPPFFSTCDGSRSDSRDDRKPDPTGPVHEQPAFGGATQNLRINGAPLVSTAFKWTPAELVRRASAAGLPWLEANSSVRMVLGRSQILLRLDLQNSGDQPRPVNLSFELPFVSRLYPEVEEGYECCTPKPLQAGPGARNTSAWRFTRRDSAAGAPTALQTAADTGGGTEGAACTAAATSLVDSAGSAIGAVELTPVAADSQWSLANTRTTLAPGARASVQIVLAVGASVADVSAAASSTAAAFDLVWSAIPGDYEERWQGAFLPSSNAHFSGNWPTLETNDTQLARTYYGSLMSMLLVNKQGIDTEMAIEEAPSPSAAKAAGGCAGTYMPVLGGHNHPPLQLRAGAGPGQLVAAQFKGRRTQPWSTGHGTLAGSTITMRYDSGGDAHSGTVYADCARIDWGARESWVRIRPAGRWNLFIAAGALLGNTAFYLWDTSGASLLWTLLDPDGMAIANDVFGSADPLLKNACDYISMAEAGKYYAFSAISEFQAIANEVRIGGEQAARRVIPMTNRTLIEQLAFVAQEYKRLPKLGPGTDLPDWGAGATHFLECQDSYQHGVAALQASQVWMLTEAATLLRATGGSRADAEEMEGAAKSLLKQMLPQLSRDPRSGGWWHALSPSRRNGTSAPPNSVEVRMIHE